MELRRTVNVYHKVDMDNETSDTVDLINLTDSSLITTAHRLSTYKAADIVNLYLPPVLIGLGVFVNILSILVMRSHYFRKVSTSVYLIAGAVNDAMGLVLALLPHWLFLNYPYVYKPRTLVNGLCMFFNFYGFSTTDVTLIFTALMTADRAYAIKCPLKAATVNTERRAKYVIAVGVLIVMAKNFHLWFCSRMSPLESTERLCVTSPSGEDFKYYVETVWPWIHNAFMSICFLVILISDVIIIINVKRSTMLSDGSRHSHANSTCTATLHRETGASHSASTSGRLRQITMMMLAESFTTLILSCPFPWYILFSSKDPNLHREARKMAMNQLLFSVFFYMLYSNKCVNFFLYVISGQKFRLALRQLLRCQRSAAEHHQATVGNDHGGRRASCSNTSGPGAHVANSTAVSKETAGASLERLQKCLGSDTQQTEPEAVSSFKTLPRIQYDERIPESDRTVSFESFPQGNVTRNWGSRKNIFGPDQDMGLDNKRSGSIFTVGDETRRWGLTKFNTGSR